MTLHYMGRMSKESYERVIDEKIEKFINETIHSPVARFWVRWLLEDLVRADIANSVDKIEKHMGLPNIAGLLSGERYFEFNGEEGECELARAGIPHAPHLIGSYMTVRYGAMDIYCLGKEGSVFLWGYRISVKIDLKRHPGGAHGRVRVEVTA